MAVHGLQLCGQFFPEEFKMWIDGRRTMDALLSKLRVELVSMRDPQQVQSAVDKIAQLAQGQPPGGIVKGRPATARNSWSSNVMEQSVKDMDERHPLPRSAKRSTGLLAPMTAVCSTVT